MKPADKIINLFCVYTFVSIFISIAAWLLVSLGVVLISPLIIPAISEIDWLMAATLYGLGLYSIHRLYLYRNVHMALFISYFALQLVAVTLAYWSQGQIYFPAAGSQGTVPALVISGAMLLYLLEKQRTILTTA